ncbi:MAG: hypothetical protein ACK4PR_12050, partial [Gammaproteobacteria bacterium]
MKDNYKKIVNQVNSTADLVNNICKEPAVELTTIAKELLLILNGKKLDNILINALSHNHFAIAQHLVDTNVNLTEAIVSDYLKSVAIDSMKKLLFTFQEGITFFIKNNFIFNDKILTKFFEQNMIYDRIYPFYYVLTQHGRVSDEVKFYLEPYKLSLLAATNQQTEIENLFDHKITATEKKDLLKTSDPKQQTLFSMACHFEYLELAKFLLTQGEKISRKYKTGLTEVTVHNQIGSNFLVRKIKKIKRSLFYFMVKAEKAKGARFLLDNKIVIKQREVKHLLSECIKSIQTSNYEMAELMLLAGMNVNKIYPPLTSQPLFFYCQDSKMLQLLIKYGANLEKRDIKNVSFSHRLLEIYLERTAQITASNLVELLAEIFNICGNLDYEWLKNSLDILADYYNSSIGDVCILITLISCNESIKYHFSISYILRLLILMNCNNYIDMSCDFNYYSYSGTKLSYNDSLLLAYLFHIMPKEMNAISPFDIDAPARSYIQAYQRDETFPIDIRNEIIQSLPILDIHFSVIDLRLLNAINLITNLKDDEPCKEIYAITCRLLDDEPGLKPAQLVHKLHSSIKSDFYKVAKISFFC